MNSAGKDDSIINRLVYRMNETGPPLLRDILHKKGRLNDMNGAFFEEVTHFVGWMPFIEGESTYWNLSWKGNICSDH